jgi:hypothetical protein
VAFEGAAGEVGVAAFDAIVDGRVEVDGGHFFLLRMWLGGEEVGGREQGRKVVVVL